MIFDSDVLIRALRGRADAARVVDSAVDRSLSLVSFMEIIQGARSKAEVQQIRRSLVQLRFTILPLSESIGSMAAAIIEQYALSHGIQLGDALIAATALQSVMPLCTGNIKHFRPVRGLFLVAFRSRV